MFLASREHSVCASLSGLGEALGWTFGRRTRVQQEVYCRRTSRLWVHLGSQCVHYATRDPDYLSRIETNAAGICVEAAQFDEDAREDDTRPLPGHMRFGDDRTRDSHWITGSCLSNSHILARTVFSAVAPDSGNTGSRTSA